jgi:hypothetical protein
LWRPSFRVERKNKRNGKFYRKKYVAKITSIRRNFKIKHIIKKIRKNWKKYPKTESKIETLKPRPLKKVCT